jgi:hypothetical protein
MKSLLIAMLGTLAGCAANAVVENGQSIEQFVADFSAKELRLHSAVPPSDVPMNDSTLSAARDAEFGYVGLRTAYAPARTQCEASAGTLRILSHRFFSKAGPNLPVRLRCLAQDKTVWELNAQYVEKHIPDAGSRRIVSLIPQVSLVAPPDNANQALKRDANLKAELRMKEKERTKAVAERAEKIAAEPVQKISKSGLVENFRKNLKAGDRVQWKTHDLRGKTVGIVARVDGELALVQFDNPSFTGQSLRYFKRSQLEPVDGNLPARATQ